MIQTEYKRDLDRTYMILKEEGLPDRHSFVSEMIPEVTLPCFLPVRLEQYLNKKSKR